MREFFADLRLCLQLCWQEPRPVRVRAAMAAGEVVLFIWYRGIFNPIGNTVDDLLRRFNRGRIGSRYWTPRVGDRVTACLSGPTTVTAVSIRRNWCRTADGREHSMRQCCSPIETGTHVAYEGGDQR